MALAGPNDIPPDFMQTFDLEEIPDPEAHPMTTDAINYDDPAAVTAALMKEFPPEALFSDDKGFTYVQYQQVLRRLIRATGNRFDIEVLDHRITPHGSTKGGVEKFLCIATVKLTIPVLQ